MLRETFVQVANRLPSAQDVFKLFHLSPTEIHNEATTKTIYRDANASTCATSILSTETENFPLSKYFFSEHEFFKAELAKSKMNDKLCELLE